MMNGTTRNKARLIWGYNFIQKGLNSINNHLNNNFIDNITQSNRTELRSKLRLINLLYLFIYRKLLKEGLISFVKEINK